LSGFVQEGGDEFARGARTYIVFPELPGRMSTSVEERLAEAEGLALAIGLTVVEKKHYRVRSPRAVTLLGDGQVKEIIEKVSALEIDLLIIDNNLTAIQQRNLEERTGVKTIDRTGLILEIFGERAASAEGKLQVELAHLDYQAGRLVRSWTHLERQRGGFGFLGGPGETQIEADRRMIRDRMARLRRELTEVKRTRALHRDRRQRAPWPIIALVGYTNAGKSTLFNQMTNAGVVAEDMLFATLDPTMRHIKLPGVEKVILSDTVGFVSDLPTQLVAAFRATLEEVLTADIILHVRDIAHPASDAQRNDVIGILQDLGIGTPTENSDETRDIPVLEIWNKIDLLDPETLAEAAMKCDRRSDVVMISAITGEGIDNLKQKLSQKVAAQNQVREIDLENRTSGAALAWLHNKGGVKKLSETVDIMSLAVSLNSQNWGQFTKLFAGTFEEKHNTISV
jgi:GTPase